MNNEIEKRANFIDDMEIFGEGDASTERYKLSTLFKDFNDYNQANNKVDRLKFSCTNDDTNCHNLKDYDIVETPYTDDPILNKIRLIKGIKELVQKQNNQIDNFFIIIRN